MASWVYADFLLDSFVGAATGTSKTDWTTSTGNTIKCQLTDNTYDEAPGQTKQETHTVLTDVSGATKVVGTTDQTLTLTTGVMETTGNTIDFAVSGSPSCTFSAVADGDTAGGVIVYNDTLTNDPLISWNKFTDNISTNGSDIEVTFSGNLVFELQYV